MIQKAERNGPGHMPAEDVAVAALGWLAREPEMLSRFLALTGLDPSDLRRLAGDAGFQAGLLEFVLAHEPSLEAFCGDSGLPPELVQAAWTSLSGPDHETAGA